MNRGPVKQAIENAIEICTEAVGRPTVAAEETAKFASAVHDMTVSYILLFGTPSDPSAWPYAPEQKAQGEGLR